PGADYPAGGAAHRCGFSRASVRTLPAPRVGDLGTDAALWRGSPGRSAGPEGMDAPGLRVLSLVRGLPRALSHRPRQFFDLRLVSGHPFFHARARRVALPLRDV